MRFVWFWTFWHWSKESFQAGALLRGPLTGIGGHWDEWFRHEASETDRQAVTEVGRTQSGSRQFVAWLCRHWARELDWGGNRPALRFVLSQLAEVGPFNQWPAFQKYRHGYGVGGFSAVVLTEESRGEAADVRLVESQALPTVTDAATPAVVAEGFQADSADLDVVRQAASSLLSGRGLLVFLAVWAATGKRPYPRWLAGVMGSAWLAAAGLTVYLLVGPDPGDRLLLLAAVLFGLWSALILAAVGVAMRLAVAAWRQGRLWSNRLEESQIRLRMEGGLTLKGGSAGLPFCLNTLFSLYRADPRPARRSWLWRRCLRQARPELASWAATGAISPDGWIKPVVLEPKLRACLQERSMRQIMTPRQTGSNRGTIHRLAEAFRPADRRQVQVPPLAAGTKLGFAAEKRRLIGYPCRHLAHSMMALGKLTSTPQIVSNIFALILSGVLLTALPDFRAILLPPPAPAVMPPASPSPYFLWVSLDTPYPQYFQVLLESEYWANRRVDVARYGGVDSSVRAEILLHRLARPMRNEEEATVWVERRNWFLTREFSDGERIGRYTLPYLTHLARS